MIQLGCRTALSGGGAHSGVGPAPPLPSGATPESRDSRTSPTPLPQGVTCWRRPLECHDPMEIDPVQGNTPQDDSPSRRARTGSRGGHRHADSDTTPGRGHNGAAAPLRSSARAGTATDERRWATASAPTEGLISTRTRVRTWMAAAAAVLHRTVGRRSSIPLGQLKEHPLSSQRWRGWCH